MEELKLSDQFKALEVIMEYLNTPASTESLHKLITTLDTINNSLKTNHFNIRQHRENLLYSKTNLNKVVMGEILDALERQHKLQAVKILKERTGYDLHRAKSIIDSL